MSDPNCEWCGGTGERYFHTEDCRSEFCALAGSIADCAGQVEVCPCVQTRCPATSDLFGNDGGA